MSAEEPAAGQEESPRRSTHVEHDVVYAAVGASSAPDLMRFPPEGSTPYEEELRLGSGADRFLIASSALMTWGAPRGAGAEVSEIEQGDGGEYAGVAFDEHGTPQPAADSDIEYGPDGEPYLIAGTAVTLRWADGRPPRRMRVVYTISEPRRVGYAWGAADDQGIVGEEVIVIEHRADDTVWATARGFAWATETGLLGLKAKAALRAAVKDARALLASLVPGALAAEGADEVGTDDAGTGDAGTSDANAPDTADADADIDVEGEVVEDAAGGVDPSEGADSSATPGE